MNGKTYTVVRFLKSTDGEKEVVLENNYPGDKNFTQEELQHVVRHSGSFRRTREEYVGIV